MVLEHVGRNILIGLCLAGAPAAAQDYMTEAPIGSFSVKLAEAGGVCTVVIEDVPALVTDLPAPCGFVHREGEALPQMQTYEPVRTVVFIAGPAPEGDCAAGLQALKLDGSTFTLGEARAVTGRFCHEGGLDEMMFRAEVEPR